ncbi:GNAT family N-acetyltransferase [Arthrobacter sp. SLBN-112]|uniref:GNAT family N-acetyltransferase n=1 Tax=Arthrobacter sp. SLBN-112 TaxID=2768452 RepID=UPI0027B73E42|nr:GNAT family N-acetyltransferase [Arthrobacter sp. SLBN-112]MDQ0798799.1 GNAT superfamily N-acetyltransferase [Arthrobacter sp. SLBN-112]
MDTERSALTVRPADLEGPDAEAVRRLVTAYLLQTEREKAVHLGHAFADGHVPGRYHPEIENPARAYAGAEVLVAELGNSPVGVAVLQETASEREIKRVWVDPGARGHRVGSALIDAALRKQDLPVRLTVWDWRGDAIRLYGKRGFRVVPAWDDRPRLLCMERGPATR